tara:strand:- start:274 stop:462 length:189 start_codon:yes stop_codon:yes gene_type:complete
LDKYLKGKRLVLKLSLSWLEIRDIGDTIYWRYEILEIRDIGYTRYWSYEILENLDIGDAIFR